jgi:hypothetical protein
MNRREMMYITQIQALKFGIVGIKKQTVGFPRMERQLFHLHNLQVRTIYLMVKPTSTEMRVVQNTNGIRPLISGNSKRIHRNLRKTTTQRKSSARPDNIVREKLRRVGKTRNMKRTLSVEKPSTRTPWTT